MNCIVRMTSLLLLLVVATTSPALALKNDEPPVEAFQKKLAPKLAAFQKAHDSARKLMLKEFDKSINNVKRSGGTAQQKIAMIEEIEGMKSEFESSETLPTSDESMGVSIQYCEKVFNATVPLRQFFEKELQNALNDAPLRDTIQSAYESWQAHIPGADELTTPERWHGRRVFQKKGNAVDFHIHVDKCDGDVFSGSLWQDALNVTTKAGLAYEGKFVGNRVQLVTTKMLHGTPRQLALTGYVIEKRMYLCVTAIDGKPANDFVSVNRK